MGDEVTIEVYDGELLISDCYTDSIQGYVQRGIDQNMINEVHLATLLVEMLNYGAEAQKAFNYDVNNLVNSIITPELIEKLGINCTNPVCEDNQVKSEAYSATSLNLEGRIEMIFKFKNTYVNNEMSAVITFKNYKGVQKTVKVAGEKFVSDGNRWAVVLSDASFVAADARSLVTCTIYDADGNVVTVVKDSIESYCARAIAGLTNMKENKPNDYAKQEFKIEFYQSLMRYSDAACANFK